MGMSANLKAKYGPNPYNYGTSPVTSAPPPIAFPHGTFDPSKTMPGAPAALTDWLTQNSGPPGMVPSQMTPPPAPAPVPAQVQGQQVGAVNDPMAQAQMFQAWLAANRGS